MLQEIPCVCVFKTLNIFLLISLHIFTVYQCTKLVYHCNCTLDLVQPPNIGQVARLRAAATTFSCNGWPNFTNLQNLSSRVVPGEVSELASLWLQSLLFPPQGNMTREDIIYLMLLLFCIPFGHVVKSINSPQVKQFLTFAVGLIVALSTAGIEGIWHSAVTILGNFILVKIVGLQYVPF